MKMARCIIKLERIKGVRKGSFNSKGVKIGCHPNCSDDVSTTQSELAEKLNISQDSVTNYKKLLKLIPEFQEMIEKDELKATVGYTVYAKMPKEEQEKFLNEIGKDRIKELTQKATKELIEEKKKLEQALREEKSKPPRVVTETVDMTIISGHQRYQAAKDLISEAYKKEPNYLLDSTYCFKI